MMNRLGSLRFFSRMLLACILVAPALAQSAQGAQKTGPLPAAVPPPAPLNFNSVASGRQATLFRRLWGIDEMHVRSTASGALVRFSYRVVDADKAQILNSKQSTPYLIDEEHGLALQVPVMDQVGQLRQVPTPQNGRDYWMAFSNKGRYVRPGSHVTLIIGSSRFKGLVVE
jgi:hypothetical protein